MSRLYWDISPSLGGDVVREDFLEEMTLKRDLKERARECEWNRECDMASQSFILDGCSLIPVSYMPGITYKRVKPGILKSDPALV